MTLSPQSSVLTSTLATGVWPAVQYFKSAAMFLEVDETGTDFIVSSAVIADWVLRFDAWYKETAGILSGERLHLVYHREVAIVGDAPLRQWQALARIGQATRQVGIGFSVTIDLEQAISHADEMQALIQTGLLSNLGIRQLDPTGAPDPIRAASAVASYLNGGLQLGLIGPVSYWRSIGLLASDELNSSNITVYPRSEHAIEDLPVPKTPIEPCFGRFRLYVDTDGSIYPCIGLLGLESARLGTVFDSFAATALGGSHSQLDLATLARKGPDLSSATPHQSARISALSPICERHRLQLSSVQSTVTTS